MFDRLFSSNEYVTIRFPKDEEILVRKQLALRSLKLEKLLQSTQDNVIKVNGIAYETFDDVIRMMNNEDPIHTDSESLKALLKAIQYLEIRPLNGKILTRINNIFKEQFPCDSS